MTAVFFTVIGHRSAPRLCDPVICSACVIASDRNVAGDYPLRKRYVNSIEVTCHQMIGGDFFLCRLDRSALWHGEGTAGMKAATGGRVDGRRDFSGQNHLLSSNVRVRRKRGRKERLGVGVERVLKQFSRLGLLHNLSRYMTATSRAM